MANAPYADKPINISIMSVTTTSYRLFHCLECGRKFMERYEGAFWRVGDNTSPRQIRLDGGYILSKCPECLQKYIITISTYPKTIRPTTFINEQSQSIYFKPELDKHERYTRCMECGKAYQTISDRIDSVVDSALPDEYRDNSKMAPFQAICKFNRCRQHWVLVV